MGNKKQLGKGIRALLTDIEGTEKKKSTAVKTLSGTANNIKIKYIVPNADQPRKDFSQRELQELAESIKTHGIIQPLTVRSLGNNEFQLISGERRYRAAKIANLKEVPVYIRTANDQELMEMALVENIQREDLNAIEIAISFQRLMEECNLTQDQLSERIGKSRSTISNHVRILKMPPQIQEAVRDAEISLGHAKAIASLDKIDQQLEVLKKIKSLNLSVRAAEKLVANFGQVKPKSTIEAKNNALIHIEKRLSAYFGSKVKLEQSRSGSGKITINFKSTDALNDILDLIE